MITKEKGKKRTRFARGELASVDLSIGVLDDALTVLQVEQEVALVEAAKVRPNTLTMHLVREAVSEEGGREGGMKRTEIMKMRRRRK